MWIPTCKNWFACLAVRKQRKNSVYLIIQPFFHALYTNRYTRSIICSPTTIECNFVHITTLYLNDAMCNQPSEPDQHTITVVVIMTMMITILNAKYTRSQSAHYFLVFAEILLGCLLCTPSTKQQQITQAHLKVLDDLSFCFYLVI